ncbi:hypothetical protein GALL_114430 [mine drainage metagenome]|uniref:Uncharacterized protein n=1 Tax=mine drainage metagenome TaxID=410659 RepID=A0A1J5SR51_9ZZZZ
MNTSPDTLILDLQSGISGDMFVAAAARLAGCEDEVLRLPATLGLDGVSLRFDDVVRSSLQARHFTVIDAHEHGDHEAHGHEHHTHEHEEHDAHHAHAHEHAHHHAHEEHDGAHAHHAHRPLSEIRALLTRARLDDAVRARALRMFQRLGEVEAAAHGIPVEKVHFHEVGAIDSILDIVAAALCIERLGLRQVFASPVCVGHGTIKVAHGVLPVPAPATERLLQGMPIFAGELSGEWTTPTGALILAELAPTFSDATLVTTASAFGAGTKDSPKRPNLLRLRLAHSVSQAEAAPAGLLSDELVSIACNIDDSTGEFLGADLLERLLQAGARDAVLHPIVMKKGRPAQQLEVLAEPAQARAIATLILSHTSTIGVRMAPLSRLMLKREPLDVDTPYGVIAVKQVILPDGSTRCAPEYESVKRAAAQAGVPAQTVHQAALAAAFARSH